jgi:transcription factor S
LFGDENQLEFCQECGSRLKPVKVHSGNQAMIMLTCSKCGAKKPEPEPAEKVIIPKVIVHDPKQFVAVIDKELDLNPMPTINIDCPRCGNNTANVWQVQTRGSDESSTQFLRCVQCGYTFRENT